MKHNRINLTTKYVIVVCVLLLAVNFILGAVLMNQSGGSLKTLTRQHMLSVADTTAALINGDELGNLTKDDYETRSEVFQRIYDLLKSVKDAQKDSTIQYIYTIKKDGDHFIFTVDPDPVAPAPYGKAVVVSPTQNTAWAGDSDVDGVPVEDEWGSFYTAWSPVRDSSGTVVGLVGVDFSANPYDTLVTKHAVTVIVACGLSLLIGSLIMLLLTGQLRRRFRQLNSELSVLSKDLDTLSKEIAGSPGYEEEPENKQKIDSDGDSIGNLSARIRDMQVRLSEYLRFIHKQAYIDSMTNVGNKTAYLDRIADINRKISEGTAEFAVAVFDVNGLKDTNDKFGHEKGDDTITEVASIIRRVFGNDRVFRIGGDEFISVLEGVNEEGMEAFFRKLDEETSLYGSDTGSEDATVSFSRGYSVFHPGQDKEFKEVFKRADRALYRDKGEYYRRSGDTSRQYRAGE